MKIGFWVMGKTAAPYLREAIADYEKRLKVYGAFEYREFPDIKNARSLSHEQLKQREGERLLEQLSIKDEVVLLDQRGKQFLSEEWAALLEHRMLHRAKSLVFVAGGAYGFSDTVYERAASTVSLSLMTFSHQMVRLIFIEQLYRAFTIIKGEPYHHA